MPKDADLRTGIYHVILRMLMPVVRICIRHSFYLNDVIEILKVAFVQVSQAQLQETYGQASASRMSAMTGVHRKDVTRLVQKVGPPRIEVSLIGRIMALWQSDTEFTTQRGTPRILECEGRDCEFAKLVTKLNGGDLSHYTVLHEMERLGIVKRTGNKLKLQWLNHIISNDILGGLSIASQDVNDLSRAVEENIFEAPPIKNLHLTTIFDKVADSAIPTIRRWLLKEGSLFHKRARKFISRYDLDYQPHHSSSRASTRVVLGTFGMTRIEKRDSTSTAVNTREETHE